MRLRKEHAVLVIFLMVSLMVVGCSGKATISEEDTYISQIEKWSYENLEQADNYTIISSGVYLELDENGNELSRTENSAETIVFYDPYKTKLTVSTGLLIYEIHQNSEIDLYAREDLLSRITVESYPNPEIFESHYIGEGEKRPGLLFGMVDYEIIEENYELVIINVTINPDDYYGAINEYLNIKSLNNTIYYNKANQKVEKVEEHRISSGDERMPIREIDGKPIVYDVTLVSEYKDINSSPDFELPEDSELGY